MIEALEDRGTSDLRARLEALAAAQPRLAEARRSAFARFEALGWPTRKLEAWKYTSVAAIARTRFGWPPPALVLSAAERRALDPDAAATRLVFVDGRFEPALSRAAAPLVVHSLDAAQAHGLPLAALALADDESHAFVALNTALCEDAASVRVPARAAPEAPVEVVLARRTPRAAVFPRLHVALEREARLTLIVRHVDLGAGASLSAGLIELVLDAGAVLDHYEIAGGPERGSHVAVRRARLERDARLRSHVFALGGALLRDEIEVLFRAPGAEAELGGLYVAGADQHVDCRTLVDHAPPSCASRQVYHGVVGAGGHGVFNGAVRVRPGAQGTQAHQTNRNLLLAASARADTKPELEIFADDVKCSHGATVGRLDDEALFYLRSRALGEREARKILTRVFAATITSAVRPVELAGTLAGALEERLSRPDMDEPTSQA